MNFATVHTTLDSAFVKAQQVVMPIDYDAQVIRVVEKLRTAPTFETTYLLCRHVLEVVAFMLITVLMCV